MNKKLLRRRQFLVIGFQNRLLLFNFLYFVTTIIVFASVLFLPLMHDLDNQELSATQRSVIAGEFLSLHARFWPAIPVAFLLLAVHSVVISHRIAGPLYRFRMVFGQIGSGDLSGVLQLRKNDYLKRDAEQINRMVDGLKTLVHGIEAQEARVRDSLAELRAALENPSGSDVSRCVSSLDEALGELRSKLGAFTTEAE